MGIPLVLQHCSGNKSQLERVVLIGDHHQLPPIVRNRALARHALLEQSLFSRLLRLGVPAIHLDKQGRSRPEIANLFNWRYDRLGDLDIVTKHAYSLANPGFAFAYQDVNVADFHGRGEYCPTPISSRIWVKPNLWWRSICTCGSLAILPVAF